MNAKILWPSAALCLVLGCNGSGGGGERLSTRDFAGAAAAPATRPVPLVVAAAAPTTRPTTQPHTTVAPVVSMGSYMIVGTVVAQANGVPIYADRVLNELNDVLALKATQLPAEEFQKLARTMIHQKIRELIDDEVEYANAERVATEEDQQIALNWTMMERQKEINRNGGSLAVTRDRHLHPADQTVQGLDFDEKLKDDYRHNLVIIYLERRMFPRAKVTAEDMRRFYDRNKEDLFTVKSGVKFRAIQVNKAGSNGAEAAGRTMKAALEKLKEGVPFGTLADDSTYNQKSNWRAHHGYPIVGEPKDNDGNIIMKHKDGRIVLKTPDGYGEIRDAEQRVLLRSKELLKDCESLPLVPQVITPGTLQYQDLEKAVFALEKPGDLTGVIDVGDALCLAQLEEKYIAQQRQFEDSKVQFAIKRLMETNLQKQLREKERAKLEDAAVIQYSPDMLEVATDMAMQKYFISRQPTTRP